jgi:tetratricopeptide (TPR) repeat protein
MREKQVALYLRTGDYKSAEQLLRAGIADESIDAAAAGSLQVALGDLLREEGKDAEARELFESALKNPAINWKQRLSATMGVAGLAGQHISVQAGLEEWTRAIAIARDHRAEDATKEADALRGLGEMWLESGDSSSAEPLLRRARKILEEDPGTTAWQLASTLGISGRIYRAQNKLALAEDAWTQALELDRKMFGELHPQTGLAMERLAEVYAVRKQVDLARQFADRALEIMRGSCGGESLAFAAALANRGLVEEYTNALPAAAEDYAAALVIARKYPSNPGFTMRIMQNYTPVLKAIHRDQEAKALNSELKVFHQQNLR